MAHKWTQKALIDDCLAELWSTSSDATFLAKTIGFIDRIQDDLIQEIPIPHYQLTLKKLLPTEQQIINLSPDKPAAPTVALASGGTLTDTTTYKVLVTFVIFDEDGKRYIESEAGTESSELLATSANRTISVSGIPLYPGNTGVAPKTIYRRVYIAKKESGESSFGEFLFDQEIADNLTSTAIISSEATSTITPPSDTEVDEVSNEQMLWSTGSGYLRRVDKDRLRRFSPDTSQSSETPFDFDFEGIDSIYLYPTLAASATNAQRTLIYTVQRRPHEVFYESSRLMDMPISWKTALIAGVKWLGYDHRDREGYKSRELIYQDYKERLKRKHRRTRGRPSSVVDMEGDVDGFEVH